MPGLFVLVNVFFMLRFEHPAACLSALRDFITDKPDNWRISNR
ncbi:hypothetical protein NY10_1617 [Carnobacterium antarcticum]|nr:hypothetical protein NY10_1617 [Carnobacterium sp. CP1]